MKKIKLYRYIGRNGIITSSVLLDGINHYVYYKLIPKCDQLLTNGEEVLRDVLVPEDEIDNWYEIDYPEGQN